MGVSRKEIALAFLNNIIAGKFDEAYALVSPTFRHHNPYFQGDAESLRKGMEENEAQHPNKTFEPKHVLVDGDFVAVHSRLQFDLNTPEMAVLHLFRFEGNQIAELWDVGQQAPQEMRNSNGMF